VSGNTFPEICKFDVNLGSAPILGALFNDLSNLLWRKSKPILPILKEIENKKQK